MNQNPADSRAVAQLLRGFGLAPLFYSRGEKHSFAPSWHSAIGAEGECIENASPDSNVGIHLRFGLADVDLDCEEARTVAEIFLPSTPFTFGKRSTPHTHRLYFSPVAEMSQYRDPLNRQMLVELRTAGPENGGVQSLCFGQHPNGDPVDVHALGAPAVVAARDLQHAVALTATTALLARYFRGGERFAAGLPLTGWLARLPLDRSTVEQIVEGIAKGCAMPEPETYARLRGQLTSTYEALAAGEKCSGRATLLKFYDAKVIETAERWLGGKAEGSTSSVRTFTVITDDEDLGIPASPTMSLLGDGIIPESGVVLVVGPMASAKTLYSLTMAYHLALGREFHGLAVPRPLKVLYLEGEGNRDNLASRRRAIRNSLDISSGVPNLMFLARGSELPKIGNELAQLVEEHEVDVLFLDTVGYFHEADENSNTAIKNAVIKPLRDMARMHKVAVVMVHHFLKKTEGLSGAARSRGASALSDDASTVITFDPKGDDTIVQTFSKIKDGPQLAPRTLRVDFAAASFEMLHGAEAALSSEPRLGVVAELVPESGSITAKALVDLICRDLNVAETKAKEFIRAAVTADLIVRAGYGRYSRRTELIN